MSLITDYRPEELDEFIGSETTVRIVESKMGVQNKPHAYLITGPSGCGKTTMGRIIASMLGASDFNFEEMDSADFRGIDTIRQIRRNMVKSPIGVNKVRVWLLDECHQLSRDAQEALLKALEDTPDHVFFILCTTDPQKLKETLKRRCLHLVVDRVDDDTIVEYLKEIATEYEEKEVSEYLLEVIAEKSDGSIGRALTLLDSIIDLDKDQAQEELDRKEAEINEAIDLCRALIKGAKWKTVSKILIGLKQSNPEKIRRAVLGYCSTVLLKGDNAQAYVVMDCFRKPFYDAPFPQLIMASYEVTME